MEDIISILIPLVFASCIVLERMAPARTLPRVRLWLLKGFVFFVILGALNAIIPAVVSPRLGFLSLFHADRMGLVAGAAVTLVVSEFVAYWVHRTMHRFHWLWRWTHQMHHSAERVDIAGAVYFHPIDSSLNVLMSTLAATLVGASPDSAALAGLLTFLMAMFQHLNVKTPRFIGYVVQRPEGHSVHHQRGLHAYNYGNLALWDQVFGTYRNPDGFSELAGFYDGASSRVSDMLLARDVAATPLATIVHSETARIPASWR